MHQLFHENYNYPSLTANILITDSAVCLDRLTNSYYYHLRKTREPDFTLDGSGYIFSCKSFITFAIMSVAEKVPAILSFKRAHATRPLVFLFKFGPVFWRTIIGGDLTKYCTPIGWDNNVARQKYIFLYYQLNISDIFVKVGTEYWHYKVENKEHGNGDIIFTITITIMYNVQKIWFLQDRKKNQCVSIS